MSYVSTDTDIASPRLGNVWRDKEHGTAHATVRLTEGAGATLYFDDPALARAVAAEIVKAAEALEALEAEGKNVTEGSDSNG